MKAHASLVIYQNSIVLLHLQCIVLNVSELYNSQASELVALGGVSPSNIDRRHFTPTILNVFYTG